MSADGLGLLIPYEPLDTPKPVAEDIWIVDGPEIPFGTAVHLPFPTRMTVVRLPGGELWLHSPTRPSERLLAGLSTLGEVRFLVAPNTLHYWWLPEWQALFPRARTFGAPGLRHAARRAVFIATDLETDPPPAWDGVLDQVLVTCAVNEVAFFHRPSRTLILTDLIENFELGRVRPWWYRALLRLAGAADPDGRAPLDLRLTFRGPRRRELRQAVRRMIAWAPHRLILAHGRWYRDGATEELRRAFRWVL